ncbi:hypothetical protein ACHAW5_004013 [Stephanodiscus triporus]|uniref:Uncharacterized protein n=1 Tax=Stephanodiscus triporus TaxID=2934178 RepID=A0ABD3P8T6_9STRA
MPMPRPKVAARTRSSVWQWRAAAPSDPFLLVGNAWSEGRRPKRRRSPSPCTHRVAPSSRHTNKPSNRTMLATIRNAAICALRRQIDRFFPPLAPQLLAGFPVDVTGLNPHPISAEESNSTLEDSLWFAVPKKKVSRGKKRMKTTLQKRIKLKDNIVIDKRTGELTLKHKLPYNWKNYLPGNAEYAPPASVERP